VPFPLPTRTRFFRPHFDEAAVAERFRTRHAARRREEELAWHPAPSPESNPCARSVERPPEEVHSEDLPVLARPPPRTEADDYVRRRAHRALRVRARACFIEVKVIEPKMALFSAAHSCSGGEKDHQTFYLADVAVRRGSRESEPFLLVEREERPLLSGGLFSGLPLDLEAHERVPRNDVVSVGARLFEDGERE
jgi:hypothetical protein